MNNEQEEIRNKLDEMLSRIPVDQTERREQFQIWADKVMAMAVAARADLAELKKGFLQEKEDQSASSKEMRSNIESLQQQQNEHKHSFRSYLEEHNTLFEQIIEVI